jgi:predicted SAM-dependent methyltransferase
MHQEQLAIRKRLEYVRLEILYEIACKGSDRSQASAGYSKAVIPKIVNQPKLLKMAGNLRLNIGCGEHCPPDLINVDVRELPGVDVVANATDLPFEPGSVSEIHSSHLVEHFPLEVFRRVLLPHWYALLQSGGLFSAIYPDWETMVKEYAKGTLSFPDFRMVLFGGQDHDGNFHFNMFDRPTMTRLLEETGFADVAYPVVGRRNGLCYEVQVAAMKPKG